VQRLIVFLNLTNKASTAVIFQRKEGKESFLKCIFNKFPIFRENETACKNINNL